VSDTELDAIVIVSPNFRHIENLTEIARHTTRPILCEKPLYTDTSQIEALDGFSKSYDAPVWVAMEYRYMPPANTGGTLVEKCCHFFDLMRLIVGAEPIRVSASAGQAVNHLEEIYDGQVSDIWDSGYVMFDFENGVRAMLELCMFADGSLWNEEISAVGAKGKIECRLPGPHRFWPGGIETVPHAQMTYAPRSPKNPITQDVVIDEALLRAGDHHGSTFFQHQKFLDVVKGIGKVEVTLNDGRRAVEMGLAAQEAATRHCVVEFYSRSK